MVVGQELTETQLAYIAGIIDGEGTLVIGKYRRDGNKCLAYRGYVGITNTNIPMLEYIQGFVGGSISRQSKDYKGEPYLCYALTIPTRTVSWLFPKLLPYFVVKRNQAEVLLGFLERQAKNLSAPISSELLQFYEDSRNKLKRLKKIRFTYEREVKLESRQCNQCGSDFRWSSSQPKKTYCSNWCKRKTHWTRSNRRVALGLSAWQSLQGSPAQENN